MPSTHNNGGRAPRTFVTWKTGKRKSSSLSGNVQTRTPLARVLVSNGFHVSSSRCCRFRVFDLLKSGFADYDLLGKTGVTNQMITEANEVLNKEKARRKQGRTSLFKKVGNKGGSHPFTGVTPHISPSPAPIPPRPASQLIPAFELALP